MALLRLRRRARRMMLTLVAGALGGMLGAAAVGCGTQGSGPPVADTWPRTPLRGFELRDPEQPYALLRLGWDLDQPAVAPRPDQGPDDEQGGGTAEPPAAQAAPLSLWGRMSPRQDPEHGQLFRAEVSDLGAAMPPALALSPAADWEGADLRSPSWLPAGAGLPPLLFYQGEDGSVGAARLADDGQVERVTTAAPLVPAAALASGRIGRMSVLRVGGAVRLYYLIDSQHAHFAQLDAAALLRRIAGEPASLDVQVSAPLLWAADFRVKQTAVVMVPAERLDGLSVRRVITPAGRERYDLYAVAAAMTRSVVVSASSYSGGSLSSTSERFLPVESPALSGDSVGTPSSPLVIAYGGRPMLLLGLHMVETGIATALLPSAP